MKLAFIMYIR